MKTIGKIPQRPSGFTYLASVTIPQCEEGGATGVREAVLLDQQMAAGAHLEMSEGRMRVPGFDPNDERFDGAFPMHPLSRARRAIHHVTTTCTVILGSAWLTEMIARHIVGCCPRSWWIEKGSDHARSDALFRATCTFGSGTRLAEGRSRNIEGCPAAVRSLP